MAGVAVAISGGGHRAALFGLGTLLYLADSSKNAEVTSISSVSGGSLTGAFVAQKMDFRKATAREFEEAVSPFARQIAQRGTVFAWPWTWVYLAALAIGLAGAVSWWWLPWPWLLRLLAFVTAFLVLAELARQRGNVCAQAFAATLFSPHGAPTKLRDIEPGIDHVLCATELHSGEHVYFSGRFVCSYELGWGEPGDLPLHLAVQASAALPGAFPLRWLTTSRHQFIHGRHTPRWMALTDGGVYDNMADQWPQGVDARKRRWPGLADHLQEPDELVVVNASAPLPWGRLSSLGIPVLGELLALLRSKDVLYDNTSSLRRWGLVGRFDRAALQHKGLRGGLVHIPRSPFEIPRDFELSSDWPDRKGRAREVLDKLKDEDEEDWEQTARANSGVKTNLSGLGTEVSARLIRHSYVLAMSNLHVILGYPLLEVPSMERFRRLVT